MTVRFTRTINPLQFEALEPKRFEDLVRQLLYDFRAWRVLEPTGRLGTDDGFDARGWENSAGSLADAGLDEDEEVSRTFTDRIWLVQCKRERSIGPSKLASYLDNIPEEERNRLHGIIFAACADFSKRARDIFREWCAAHGVQEFYLWGKAELEDALFRPQNDHLLFAYFGLSLAIRRRSDQARLRSQTTIKRKLTRAIAESREVLLRDVKDENYPYTDTSDVNFKWWVFARPKMTFRGLELVARRYFGYIADDGEHWDVANVVDDTRLSEQKDPWRGSDNLSIERRELFEFWDKLSDYNKARFETRGVVPFASIVEIDEVGDDLTPHPHIYIEPSSGPGSPFEEAYPELVASKTWVAGLKYPTASNRIEIFPAKFRRPLKMLTGRNGEDAAE